MNEVFKKGQTVLFQGDSITDNGRGFLDNGFGYGYPLKIKQIYDGLFSDDNDKELEPFPPNKADSGVNFVNLGISGNTIRDLLARYDSDFLAVKPDYVSILIGVNDMWHFCEGYGEHVTPELFEERYDLLLSKIKADMPDTKIIIMAPFIFKNALLYEGIYNGLVDFWPIVERMAEKYADYYIPLNKVFDKLLETHKPEEFARDGVHPTPYGHSVIAREYLKTLGIVE